MTEVMKVPDVSLEGIVEKVTFYNSDNGYAVFNVTSFDDIDNEITCVGYVPDVKQGESIKITGTKVFHQFYGEQISVEIYEKTEPKTERAILLYLSSGVIKGVGPRIGKKIVDKFGCDTLSIMSKNPERLAEIRGISKEKAINIGEVFKEQEDLRRAIMFLGGYGVKPSYALKIYKKYKSRTIDVVSKNPYSLADDITGIGFKIADNIAAKLGIPADSKFRIRAGVKYMLNYASTSGHVYLPMDILIERTSELLSITPEKIDNEMTSMHIENYIWIERSPNFQRVYLNFFYYSESYVSRRLVELSQNKTDQNVYEDEIDALENANKIHFAPQQRLAITKAMQNGVQIITGGPGTGKTTIINAIIKLCEAEGLDVSLAAPTGRAAKRMEEATGKTAQTIHRLLGVERVTEDSKQQSFERNEENPLETDVVIIDESSMVDILLMNSLLKAIQDGTRLILVGDANQLPSVGPGNVLKDIINSGIISVVSLTEIFRQAKASAIITNAHKINNGTYPDLTKKDSDFFFMKRYNVQELCSLVVSLVKTRLPKYLDCDPIKDIQVLSPMRKSPVGVKNLNAILQEALNPPSKNKIEKEFRGTIFREGDKVMQIKNNYNTDWKIVEKGRILNEGTGVYNGDEGIISYIDEENEYVEVVFEESKIVHYDFTQLDELELSYAVTIHKSQGSEYKAVVMPILSGTEILLTRNLLYTGLTRAKKLAVICGSPEMVYRMVDNNREINRYTSLKSKIIEFNEFINNN
ncbi:MAG: ATP-dependent RecD-like DNA helicase [Lachnospirales bacterium]